MTDDLERLEFLLDQRLPAQIVAVMLELANDRDVLIDVRGSWNSATDGDDDAWRYTVDACFVIERITGEDVSVCDDCDAWAFWDDMSGVRDVDDDDVMVCSSCADRYSECSDCRNLYSRLQRIDGNRICDTCRDAHYYYCDNCEEWYHEDENHDFDHDGSDDGPCDCESFIGHFAFPADGHGTVNEDERLTVELPKGTISDIGLAAIVRLVNSNAYNANGELVESWEDPIDGMYHYLFTDLVEAIGPLWQTKQGNFTKRLASALYKHAQVKLDPAIISEIGNTARAHSSGDAVWHVEVTRALNESASYFVNSGSCWFTGGDYGHSRCALKSWGGMGLRTFADGDTPSHQPNGRTWVLPLNAELQPTHDAVGARAYLVFNGYGTLEGYTPARIVAHLTGLSYRKVEFDPDAMYVNGEGERAYLIADAATCAATDHVSISLDFHDHTDYYSVRNATRIAKEMTA